MQPEIEEAVRDWLANAQEDVETAELVEQSTSSWPASPIL